MNDDFDFVMMSAGYGTDEDYGYFGDRASEWEQYSQEDWSS
jgi:hypothetical protein